MNPADATPWPSLVERVFREVHGPAIATLVRQFGDISLAEDAVQDAFTVATDRWRTDGIPPNPAGWIVTTARHRAIDDLRRSARGRELQQEAAELSYPMRVYQADVDEGALVPDDRLRLIFTCCHPALRIEHQVALTLRLLGGLRVDEIARSFLVSEAAMAKRLVRAKYKIKAANIPYRVPAARDLPRRLRPVLAVLYLIYNTGADDPGRAPLTADAIRLARALTALMPDEPEVAGLLALMLLNESRMPGRFEGEDVVLLRDQDRTRWDRALIHEGQTIVRDVIRHGRPGPYQLQAAIQAVHCGASAYETTDWSQIFMLYNQLYDAMPTPVVAMNRAIAVGEVEGPGAELAELDRIAPDLDRYHLLHAARGDALRQLGERDAARAAFDRAARLAPTTQGRKFLADQIEALAREG